MGNVTYMQVLTWKAHPKQRPRRSKTGVIYTPKESKQAEMLLRAQWRMAPIEGPLHVKLVMDDESVSVQITPRDAAESKMRGDIDNYAKTVLDALNGIAWEDDRQIKSLEVVIR
jgi:crossover junction endodeoxyribonuclease RusA